MLTFGSKKRSGGGRKKGNTGSTGREGEKDKGREEASQTGIFNIECRSEKPMQL